MLTIPSHEVADDITETSLDISRIAVIVSIVVFAAGLFFLFLAPRTSGPTNLQQMALIPLVPAVSTIADPAPSETTPRTNAVFIDHSQEFINHPSAVEREYLAVSGIYHSPRSATVRRYRDVVCGCFVHCKRGSVEVYV